ncbi:MAG: peptidyl-prolyl cis-trans isomerase [Planctomycetes bacterium]|nr:peptidyl-prolyl cis-trans isomerase [Planctomycetota bacterium]
MRIVLLVAGLLAALTVGARAQVEIHPAQPQAHKPPKLPPVAEVRKEIEAARGVVGVDLPPAEMLQKPAGRVDGQVITLDALLDEVMLKYGAPLVPLLANQALMEMEAIKRGVEVSEEELVEEVRHHKAQSGSDLPLQVLLENSRMGWDRFERSLRTKAAIHKIAKADQNIKDAGPPNQFLLQIWAGSVRPHYQIELKQENLPAGCFARVESTWGLADVLHAVREAAVRARPYTLARSPGKSGAEVLVFTPADGGWPRFIIPAVKVSLTRVVGGAAQTSEMDVEELLRTVVEGRAEIEERLLAFAPEEQAPRMVLPMVEVSRTPRKGAPPERAKLTDAVNALLQADPTSPYTVDVDAGQIRPAEGDGAVYTVPPTICPSWQPPFRARLIEVLRDLATSGHTLTPQLLLSRQGEADFVMLPPVQVTMRTDIDRPSVLALSFGSMKLAQFEDALENLARFLAVKNAFAGRIPGTPAGAEAAAPWGVITVSEQQVQERIAAERAKYDGTIFPWEMICQILGKTVPEEMRRFWVGNGVDQIIGSQVDEATLEQYYQDNILNFGVATVEANHILLQCRDEKTGRIDWEAARARAEQVLAMIRTGADFGAMAAKYSDDPATADKDGDLGLFTLVSRYDLDLCKAAFALQAGEISSEPARTRLGYHILQVRRRAEPDLTKYGWNSEGMRERVREAWLEERQEKWLADNVYGKFRLESYLEEIFP